MLLWKRYGNNKMAAILHLQQYSRRLNFYYFVIIPIFCFARPLRLRCSFLLASQQPLPHINFLSNAVYIEPRLYYLSLFYCCKNIAENVNYEAHFFTQFSPQFLFLNIFLSTFFSQKSHYYCLNIKTAFQSGTKCWVKLQLCLF